MAPDSRSCAGDSQPIQNAAKLQMADMVLAPEEFCEHSAKVSMTAFGALLVQSRQIATQMRHKPEEGFATFTPEFGNFLFNVRISAAA